MTHQMIYHHRAIPKDDKLSSLRELENLLSEHGLTPILRSSLPKVSVDWYDHRTSDDPFYDFLPKELRA